MAEPHEAAKWRVEDHRDDAPTAEPMNGKGTKPAQRKKPDSDQKKVRRELARSAGYSGVHFYNDGTPMSVNDRVMYRGKEHEVSALVPAAHSVSKKDIVNIVPKGYIYEPGGPLPLSVEPHEVEPIETVHQHFGDSPPQLRWPKDVPPPQHGVVFDEQGKPYTRRNWHPNIGKDSSHPSGDSREYDICANCGESIHDASGIDPNVPWVHEGSGNSRCDVSQPADAVMLRGIETDEAHPMYKNSYTPRDFLRTVMEDFDRRQQDRSAPAKSWNTAETSDSESSHSESGGGSASSTTALGRAPEIHLSPGAQHADLGLHTRTVPEDSDFDPYLVSRCPDHGGKVVADRPSQERYIALSQECHSEAHGPDRNVHNRWHHSEGHECWSCCPDMYIARPGERESGRTASMRKGAPFAGYEDFAACVRANQDKDDPEAYCGSIKHKVEGMAVEALNPYGLPDIDEAGHRECAACGQVGSPVLGPTGPTCSRCGSYSLKVAPHKQPARAAYSAKTGSRMDTNVATSDGRILINPGDQIKTPTGQALTVKNIRRHETSRDHYYVDTDAGTTLVPWTTNFTLVPNNQSQQFLPDTGTPGGSSNALPSLETPVSNTPPNLCPACGAKGSLTRQGQSFKCTRCGYTDKSVGLEQNFSDATQQFVPRTSSLIAQRAQQVLDQEEEIPL